MSGLAPYAGRDRAATMAERFQRREPQRTVPPIFAPLAGVASACCWRVADGLLFAMNRTASERLQSLKSSDLQIEILAGPPCYDLRLFGMHHYFCSYCRTPSSHQEARMLLIPLSAWAHGLLGWRGGQPAVDDSIDCRLESGEMDDWFEP